MSSAPPRRLRGPPTGRDAIPFLAVFGTLLVALHAWLWWRLVHGAGLGPLVDLLGAAVFAGGALAVLGTLVPRLLRRRPLPGVAPVGHTWLGLVFLAAALAFVLEPVHAGLGLVGADGWQPLLSGGTAALVLALGAGGSVVARYPRVHRVEVPIEGLDPALDGLGIAQISDVHVGAGADRTFVRWIVDQVHALRPDLIALTGDLVDGPVDAHRDDVAPLAELRAPLGRFAVIGNHELYAGVEPWVEHLSSLGLDVLRNRHVVVERGGARLVVAGVDDPFGHPGPDLGRALAGRDPSLPILLLSHQPVTIDDAARHGVAVQLSGHTHGGQIMPFGLAVRTQQPYLGGLVRHGPTWLYVHQGTGTWGPRMRVGTVGEIVLIVLRSAPR